MPVTMKQSAQGSIRASSDPAPKPGSDLRAKPRISGKQGISGVMMLV